MNILFDRKPISVWRAIISVFLIIIAFLGLVFSEIIISFTFLTIAGLIGLYLTYGLDGIKLAFSPLQKGATKIILISYVWNILQSFAIALSLKYIFHYQFAANSASGIFEHNTPVQFLLNFIVIVFSLIGEECLVLVPSILGIYYLKRKGINEKWAMILITLIGAFIFGLAHYFTYQGNLIQIFAVIALARLPFNWAAFKANSIWAGAIAHILFDVSTFLLTLLS
ncbi:CAAX protease family protein [Bacillus thuringiensis serovar zhaodongensis]|uniref:CPBP family glutamic-type intramembrane protease n=1 Tax=Bacillus thuringiensis TaxID=1428 RepID=UPI000A362639|nr:CPBP family glutamic-type intramembrane protease [Bacillus thuringiensis]OUB75930.1 CAAX protease family protein [Bacillus thuringiensis serovar zhaodongensis]